MTDVQTQSEPAGPADVEWVAMAHEGVEGHSVQQKAAFEECYKPLGWTLVKDLGFSSTIPAYVPDVVAEDGEDPALPGNVDGEPAADPPVAEPVAPTGRGRRGDATPEVPQ